MVQENSQREGEKDEIIKGFTKKLENWKENLKKEENKGDRVATDFKLPEYEILGFKNEIKSLQNFLLDQKVYKEFKSLVIVGEYGVGKTALCQKILDDKDVQRVYAPRIWVSMHSEGSNKEDLDKKICVVKKILKGLGVEDSTLGSIKTDAVEEKKNKQEAGKDDGEKVEEKELAALLYALHLNLRWKKYLIVFDDVREEDKWDEKLDVKVNEDEKWGKYLSDGFPRGSGGRVIYTTRDEKLAEKLVEETHQIHRLWPLSDHHSVWEIYKAAVEKLPDREVPRNDKKCIDELMNKSRGLPLAARLLAERVPVFLDDETEPNDPANGTPDPPNGTSS